MTIITEFMNPNHDARGRFATSSGGSSAPDVFWSPGEFSMADKVRAARQLLKDAGKLQQTLTETERVSLLDYSETFQGSHAMNSALKGGPLYTSLDGQRQSTLKSLHGIEELFARTPLNKAPLLLMRGVGGASVSGAFGQTGSLVDKVISSDALTSTSMDLNYAAYAARATSEIKGVRADSSVLMVMYVQPGTVRALPLSDVLYSNMPGLLRPTPGLEVLLPPGSKIKVHTDVPNYSTASPEGRVFDRILVGEVLPEDPAYKPRYSVREGVTLFFNPAHDKRGRFATTGTGGRGRFGTPADPDESDGLKASLNMGPVKSEQKLTGGMSGAFVSRATTQDGRDVVVKMTGTTTVDREYLTAKVNDALGGSPVHVARLREDMIVSDYIDGPTGREWGMEHGGIGPQFAASKVLADRMPGAREMGLLDKITANHDRHTGNWVVKEGRVYPIDNGDCGYWERKAGYYDDNGVFAERVTGANAHINPLYQTSELVALRPKVDSLAPEFARLGHPDWHQNMMGRMDAVISNRIEMDAAAVQRAADMKEFGLTE